jgi:glycosyltransferase involved in cell wall biosynthesis
MPTRVALVANIPAPYRVPVYGLLAAQPGLDLRLFFCSERESEHTWNLDHIQVPHVFLRERVFSWRGRVVHANVDVWAALRAFRPDVVVTTGFSPTHLLAFAYARLHGARHVAMTDGTVASEARLSVVHRWIRRHMYRRTEACVGASEGSLAIYRQYGVPAASMFKSQLCADNEAFASVANVARDVDFVFCGRFAAGKQPLFAIQVAALAATRLGRRVRLMLVGSGPLDASLRQAVARVADRVDAEFAGFATQAELPGHYARARLMLFPSAADTWGVVANEACAAGVPVLVSPQASVAGDLVLDGQNGRVLPLDATRWAVAAAELLSDDSAWRRMSRCSLDRVRPCTYANAALGLADAVAHATRHGAAVATAVASPRPRVVLVQRRMTHYRVPLFERMRALLNARGVDLNVVYGDPMPHEVQRGDGGVLAWGQHVRCRYALSGRLCWQWAWPRIRGADLVIVTQENKLLLNHLLGLLRFMQPLAFWGHGRNFQSTAPSGLRERSKRLLGRHADWWFAYTALSADAVRAIGFAPQKITVLNNAIDTSALAADLQSLAQVDDAQLRAAVGLKPGPVALVMGSLYAGKGIAFVLDAARLVRAAVPEFQLLVVGDGPDRRLVDAAARVHPWVHGVGVRQGIDKARCLRVASLMLNPFGIGLVVLDSFAAGVPMVVTASAGHGPEFAYLQHAVNCVVAPADPPAYAAEVIALLIDASRRDALARNGMLQARELTLERMAERFCEGIEQCLGQHVLATAEVVR